MNVLQEQISKRLRDMMERRLARWLRVDEKELAGLTAAMSLADLLNGIFVLEGHNETIGAYAGAIQFLCGVVGLDELYRRPNPPTPEPEQKPEMVH